MLLFALSVLVTLLGQQQMFYFLLLLSPGEVSTQNIKPLDTVKRVSEGDPVTLSCSYSDSNAYNLQWYRQYPSSGPEFLLFAYEKNQNSDSILSRITAEVIKAKDQSHVNLTISSAAVSDSALYYCTASNTVSSAILLLKCSAWTLFC
uniref:Ig-like domain-containing protein n=1 Tax=Electrophorus electricus TaxID=8005 RepID=A0A4W4EGI6_ELEEL